MRALGLPELLIVLFTLVVYGLVFWVVWKFYQVLSRINDNIGGIRRVMEQQPPDRPLGM